MKLSRTNKKEIPLPTPDISFSSAVGLPAVCLKNACKSFGEKTVLKKVSLSLQKGEVLSIIGPSGAGKSTLLRCLTLLERFDAGRLSYGSLIVCDDEQNSRSNNFQTVYDTDALQKARMQFGIVFQDYNLFPHMSVKQNIMDAPLVVQKRPKEEVEAKTDKLLAQLNLTEHAHKVPCELSGGQQQRVAIARALCMNPSVMFFDEATSALDPRLTQDISKIIKQLAKEGMAIAVVTHEMDFARSISDRVVVLIDGVVAEEGPVSSVLTHPKDERVQRFLAEPEKA